MQELNILLYSGTFRPNPRTNPVTKAIPMLYYYYFKLNTLEGLLRICLQGQTNQLRQFGELITAVLEISLYCCRLLKVERLKLELLGDNDEK